MRDYLGCDGQGMAWALSRAACASVADMAIYPMQAVLGVDGTHRMNQPGVGEGNWVWRFQWSQVGPEPAQRLRHLAHLCDRLPRPPGESHAAA